MTEADTWERCDPWLRPPDIGTYANENWSSDMWTFKKKRGTYEEGVRATNEHLAKMRQKLQKKTRAAEVVDAGGQDVAGRSSMDIFASRVEDADESAFMPDYYRPGEATGPGLGCPDYDHTAAFESMHLQATQKDGWMSCPGTCGKSVARSGRTAGCGCRQELWRLPRTEAGEFRDRDGLSVEMMVMWLRGYRRPRVRANMPR